MSQRIRRRRPTFAVSIYEHRIRESKERSDHDQARSLLADGAHGRAGAGGRHGYRHRGAAGRGARLLALERRHLGVDRRAGLRSRLLPAALLLSAVSVLSRLLRARALLLRPVGGVLVPDPLIRASTYPGASSQRWLLAS